MGIRNSMGFPHAPSFAKIIIRKVRNMTQYKKFIDDKNLPIGAKKRPGQSGYDGNKELRTRIVQVAYSPSEYADLENQCDESANSRIASFVRQKSLSKAIKVDNKNKLKVEAVAEIYQLSKATDITQTGRMGNNLNQIARKLNGNEGVQNFKEKMLDELKLMREMNKKLEAALLKLIGGDL
jgi:hypothetical protein